MSIVVRLDAILRNAGILRSGRCASLAKTGYIPDRINNCAATLRRAPTVVDICGAPARSLPRLQSRDGKIRSGLSSSIRARRLDGGRADIR
jgi:hypothetical protein